MELTQLRYFAEVAESLHMTKSAEKLHIAQPALSQAIRRLEEDVGVKLLKLSGRNIALTEYGAYLKQALAPVLEELDRIPTELRRMAKANRETVKINVSAASLLVTEAIIAYKRENEVNFSLFQGSGISDVTVSTTAKRTEEAGFCVSEKIFLAAPRGKNYPDRICLQDLEDEDFICLAKSAFREICDKYCRRAGFRPKIAFESDNPASVRNMIAANMGVGFWPEFTWGNVDPDRIKLSEIADLPFARDIVITLDPQSESPHAERFYEYLTDYFLLRKGSYARMTP